MYYSSAILRWSKPQEMQILLENTSQEWTKLPWTSDHFLFEVCKTGRLDHAGMVHSWLSCKTNICDQGNIAHVETIELTVHVLQNYRERTKKLEKKIFSITFFSIMLLGPFLNTLPHKSEQKYKIFSTQSARFTLTFIKHYNILPQA